MGRFGDSEICKLGLALPGMERRLMGKLPRVGGYS
jgi:hypothetical protein